MKKKLLMAAICCYTVSLCQVGINTDNPKGALHIQNTTKEMGLVLPIVGEAPSTVTPSNTDAVEATLVYDNSLKCIRLKTNTKWSDCLLDASGVTTIINNTYNGNSTASNGKIRAVDADGDFLYQSVYIDANDKNVYTMGYGGMGAVGTNTVGYQRVPVKIIAEPCIDVASGYYSGYAVTATGKLYSWGYNIYGKNGLDYPSTITTDSPTEVLLPSGVKAVKVESSYFNTIVLGDDGKLYTMGANFNYMNGNNVNTGWVSTPTVISSGSLAGNVVVTDFAMAQDKVCAIDSTGKLHYWGYNIYYQNTSPSLTGWTQQPTASAIFIGGSTNSAAYAKDVACTSNSTIVLDGLGKIHRFGNNNEHSGGVTGYAYNHGDNVTLDSGESIVKVKGMDSGIGIGSFALITKQSNTSVKPNVYVSGYNYFGKLGASDDFGFVNNSTSWQKVSITSMAVSEKVVDVALGYYHALYITGDDNANGTIDTNDYDLFGAGYAFPGPLGSSYQNNPNIPTQLKN